MLNLKQVLKQYVMALVCIVCTLVHLAYHHPYAALFTGLGAVVIAGDMLRKVL